MNLFLGIRLKKIAAAFVWTVIAPLWLSIGCHSGIPSAGEAQSFCVAFYNVENLFDIVHNGSEYDLYTPSPTGWNQYAYGTKVSNIASALKDLGADIVGLCEIENRRAMEDLRLALKRRGLFYPFAAIADSTGSNTSPVLFSRYPVLHSTSIDIQLPDNTITRPILAAMVLVGRDSLQLLVNHWPSKHWPASHRIIAARALRRYLAGLPQEQDYLIVGDLNCNFDEWESIVGSSLNDRADSTSISSILGTVKAVGGDGYCYETARTVKRSGHVDLWTDLDPRYRCSYVFRGQPQTPDHILAPPSMFDSEGFSYVPGSFDVFTWQGRLLYNGSPFRWEVKYRDGTRQHTARGYSDHLPVYAYVESKPYTAASNNQQADDGCRRQHTSGFENGFEGWTPVTGKVRWVLDTAEPREGRFNLRLRGKLARSSAIARKSWRVTMSENVHATFHIRGRAKLGFRYRWDDSRWRFVRLTPLRYTGRSPYALLDSRGWESMAVSLGRPPSYDAVLSVEFRAQKGAVDIHLDDMRLVPEN